MRCIMCSNNDIYLQQRLIYNNTAAFVVTATTFAATTMNHYKRLRELENNSELLLAFMNDAKNEGSPEMSCIRRAQHRMRCIFLGLANDAPKTTYLYFVCFYCHLSCLDC